MAARAGAHAVGFGHARLGGQGVEDAVDDYLGRRLGAAGVAAADLGGGAARLGLWGIEDFAAAVVDIWFARGYVSG